MRLTDHGWTDVTPQDVWWMLKQRFNAAEVAHVAGVSLDVAHGMIAEATPTAFQPAYGLEQAA